MPTYVYRRESNNRRVELTMTIDEHDLREKDGVITLDDGTTAKRDLVAEFGYRRRSSPGNWPMESDAAGVHPKQIHGAMVEARRRGVPTSFTPDGRAIFTSRGHRKKYCEAFGFYDRNAGFGDPCK